PTAPRPCRRAHGPPSPCPPPRRATRGRSPRSRPPRRRARARSRARCCGSRPSRAPRVLPAPSCLPWSSPERCEVDRFLEGVPRGREPRVGALALPAAEFAVGAELLLDVGAREGLVLPSAQVRLALFQHAPV